MRQQEHSKLTSLKSGCSDLRRIESEIQWCSDYIKSDKPDKAGARLGIDDWLMEEALIKTG